MTDSNDGVATVRKNQWSFPMATAEQFFHLTDSTSFFLNALILQTAKSP